MEEFLLGLNRISNPLAQIEAQIKGMLPNSKPLDISSSQDSPRIVSDDSFLGRRPLESNLENQGPRRLRNCPDSQRLSAGVSSCLSKNKLKRSLRRTTPSRSKGRSISSTRPGTSVENSSSSWGRKKRIQPFIKTSLLSFSLFRRKAPKSPQRTDMVQEDSPAPSSSLQGTPTQKYTTFLKLARFEARKLGIKLTVDHKILFKEISDSI